MFDGTVEIIVSNMEISPLALWLFTLLSIICTNIPSSPGFIHPNTPIPMNTAKIFDVMYHAKIFSETLPGSVNSINLATQHTMEKNTAGAVINCKILINIFSIGKNTYLSKEPIIESGKRKTPKTPKPIAIKNAIKVIGIRHGEKMYETLLTNEECANAEDMGNFYRVPCDKRGLNYDKYFNKGDTERNTLTEFNSNNTKLLTVEETKAKIASLAYIQEEMAKMEKK